MKYEITSRTSMSVKTNNSQMFAIKFNDGVIRDFLPLTDINRLLVFTEYDMLLLKSKDLQLVNQFEFMQWRRMKINDGWRHSDDKITARFVDCDINKKFEIINFFVVTSQIVDDILSSCNGCFFYDYFVQELNSNIQSYEKTLYFEGVTSNDIPINPENDFKNVTIDSKLNIE